MRYLIAALMLLPLSACHNFNNPGPLPTGYAYHDKPFNAKPGPEARGIGYDYSAEKNAQVLRQLRAAAVKLVADLERSYDLNTNAIYLYPAPVEADGFSLSLAHVLREVLAQRGFVLTAAPEFSLGLKIDVKNLNPGNETAMHERLNADIQKPDSEISYYREVEIALALSDPQGAIGEVSGNYIIPVYGYSYKHFTSGLYDYVVGRVPNANRWELEE